MTTKTLCKCGHEISQHSYSENFTGCDIEKCDCDLDMGLFVDEQAATIARLTAANESMQEDAVQNTYAFNLMLTANKAQAAEIAELKGIAANLAKHLEAINNICEREDVDYQAWKKIRAHCEAANVMEAL